MRRTSVRRNLLLALVVAGVAAGPGCEQEAPPAEPDGAIDVDALSRFDLDEVFRIGSLEDPDLGFSGIGSVEVGRDGRIYVYENQDRQVRVYASDGTLERRIGRPGEGPGEFAGSQVELQVQGDTLWTVDQSAQRITRFGLESGVLSTSRFDDVWVPMHYASSESRVIPALLTGDGHLLGRRGSTRVMGMPPGDIVRDVVPYPILRFDADGAVRDTAGFLPIPASSAEDPEVIDVGRSQYILPRAPGAQPISVLFPDGHVVVDRPLTESSESGTFRVTGLTLGGDTVYHRAFRYTPMGFPDAVLDAAARQTASREGPIAYLSGGSVTTLESHAADSAAAREAILDRMEFPDFQPPVRSTHAGADGSLWLRREDAGAETHVWLVLAPGGEPLGTVAVPAEAAVRWADAEGLVVTESDDFDVPWLVRYRLVDR